MARVEGISDRWVDPMGDIDRHPDGARMIAVIAQGCGSLAHAERNRALLPLLDLRPGETALEVGCGSGALLRERAGLTGGHARLVGVDPSGMVLDQARWETEADGGGASAGTIEYRRMDGRALAFPADAFDAAVCSRVLIHAEEPERIVAEMARVVRPGGHGLCIEPAHQFWAGVDDQLRENASSFTNTFIGHELPDLAGMRADLAAGTGMIGAAVRAGRCTVDEVEELFAQTERAIERGTFLFCSVHFAVLGHKGPA